MNQGKLVSDEIIFQLLAKRLEGGEAKGESGFILDGFPRTIKQAVRFFQLLKTDILLSATHNFILCIFLISYRPC